MKSVERKVKSVEFKIPRDKFFGFLLLFTLYSTLYTLSSRVHAQTAPPTGGPTPKKVKVTYPVTIPNVGTCNDWTECRKLCEDPINRQSCYTWAKDSLPGSVPKDYTSQLTQAIQQFGQQELGCSTPQSCEAVCSVKENYDRCETFASSHGLTSGHVATVIGTMIQRKEKEIVTALITYDPQLSKWQQQYKTAQELLKSYCDKGAHPDACQRAAQLTGLLKSAIKSGPGGCFGTETCRRYCDDPKNISECSAYGYKGPKNCDNAYDCWQTCQQDSSSCKMTSVPKIPFPSSDPEKVKKELSSFCSARLVPYEGEKVDDVAKMILTTASHCDMTDADKRDSCRDYLKSKASDKFSPDEFKKYCTVVPLPPPVDSLKSIAITGTGAIASDATNDLISRCRSFSIVSGEKGKTTSDSCEQFVNTYKNIRDNCALPPEKRTTAIDEESYAKYCLSVPQDMTDFYKKFGTSFDDYCTKTPAKCEPLYNGVPFARVMQSGLQSGLQAGLQSGLQAGIQSGLQSGLQAGIQSGLTSGFGGQGFGGPPAGGGFGGSSGTIPVSKPFTGRGWNSVHWDSYRLNWRDNSRDNGKTNPGLQNGYSYPSGYPTPNVPGTQYSYPTGTPRVTYPTYQTYPTPTRTNQTVSPTSPPQPTTPPNAQPTSPPQPTTPPTAPTSPPTVHGISTFNFNLWEFLVSKLLGL